MFSICIGGCLMPAVTSQCQRASGREGLLPLPRLATGQRRGTARRAAVFPLPEPAFGCGRPRTHDGYLPAAEVMIGRCHARPAQLAWDAEVSTAWRRVCGNVGTSSRFLIIDFGPHAFASVLVLADSRFETLPCNRVGQFLCSLISSYICHVSGRWRMALNTRSGTATLLSAST